MTRRRKSSNGEREWHGQPLFVLRASPHVAAGHSCAWKNAETGASRISTSRRGHGVGHRGWYTFDRGGPGAALSKRDLRARVIRHEDLPGLMPDPRLCGLIVLAPEAPGERGFVNDAFRLIRAAGPALEKSAARGGAALLTVSRLEGTFGLTGLGAESSPDSGALAGMAKTAGHEWRDVHCKAVDVAPGFDSPSRAADLIVNELFHRGPAEVALTPEGRVVVELEPVVNRGSQERRPVHIERGDLVVISGGARGVTGEVALALAEAFGSQGFVLLGRTIGPCLPSPTRLAGSFMKRPRSSEPYWNGRMAAGRCTRSARKHGESWPSARSAISSRASNAPARRLFIARSTCETRLP